MKNIDIQLKDSELSSKDCIDFVRHFGAGGVTTFMGTVRNKTRDKKVLRLEFEAFKPMAIKEMNKIAEHIMKNWDAFSVCIHHRVGTLEVGDIPVIISVSTPHRKESFEACQFAIDTLKKAVPIWKKEIFEDGEVWVAAHP